METQLKIPFDKKDWAKTIAKDNHCALFWEPNTKTWRLKGNSIPSELEGYVIEDESNGKKSISTIKEEPYTFILNIPFMMKDILTEYGGHYSKEHKASILKTTNIPPFLEQFTSSPYSLEAFIEKELNGDQYRNHIKEQFAKTNLIEGRYYQNDAKIVIDHAYKKGLNGFLLADDVGLGKTITTGLFLQDKPFQKILIVTTLAAVPHWRNVFLKMIFKDKDIIIINYDKLQKLFDYNEKAYKSTAKTRKTKNKRLAGNAGVAEEFDAIVFDESHKLKNNTTIRTKLAMKLAEKSKFVLYLSATAGQNPLELSYLAPLIAQVTGESVKNMQDFEKWCQKMKLGITRGDFGKWLWDGSQESIDKIQSWLFKGKIPAAIRRIPNDIKGYPEISRNMTTLEFDAEEIHQYNLMWSAFQKEVQNVKSSSGKDKKNGLVAQLRFRQKASLLKIPYTIEYTEDLLENGNQVAISVAFKDTLFQIRDQLEKKKIKCSVIHGELNVKEKEAERLKFQKGETTVVLFTVEEAISLHQGEHNNAPRAMLIHDLRWSGISMTQIEGRTHRDGKFSQIYWLYIKDTIEEQIAQIVLNRVINMKSLVGDDTQVLKDIEALFFKD